MPSFHYDGDECIVQWYTKTWWPQDAIAIENSQKASAYRSPWNCDKFPQARRRKLPQQFPKPFLTSKKKLPGISLIKAKANARALSLKFHRQYLREMEKSRDDSPSTTATSFSPDSSAVFCDDMSVNSYHSTGGVTYDQAGGDFYNEWGQQNVHNVKYDKDQHFFKSHTSSTQQGPKRSLAREWEGGDYNVAKRLNYSVNLMRKPLLSSV